MAVTASPRSLRNEPSSRPRQATDQPARTWSDRARDLLASPLADYLLIATVSAILLALGFMMVVSASSVVGERRFGDPYYFAQRQAVFLGVGLVMAWSLSRRSLAALRALGWVGLCLAVVLLSATFVPGLGINVNGNRNWLQLGTSILRIQPSEFAKLAMIVWGATVLASKQKLLDQPRHLLFPFVPTSMLLIGLVAMENDLGTAMVMSAIMMAILFCVGAPKRVLAALVLGGVAVVGIMVKVSANRSGRLSQFASGEQSQQVERAMYALASGGWWGRGLGQSRQKWGSLPEAHTDYVFAVLGEELGLVGTLLVVGLFLALGALGLRVALRSDKPFARYAAAGITCWFLVQASINILVVLNLLPVLGVPLPLLSYGGSALLANLLALGVLLACARNEPDARRVLARRSQTPRPRLSTVVDGGR